MIRVSVPQRVYAYQISAKVQPKLDTDVYSIHLNYYSKRFNHCDIDRLFHLLFSSTQSIYPRLSVSLVLYVLSSDEVITGTEGKYWAFVSIENGKM